MNLPVNFEIAKLLKEKGFDIPCREGWINYLVSFTGETKMPDDESNLVIDRLGNRHLIERPTIAEVIMWLYEKHKVWISPWMASEKSWGFHILRCSDGHVISRNEGLKNSPTEAYEAAILYTLNNLI